MARPFKGNLSDNDIALLREFITVADAKGLSAAEARLNKGKSAISLNLKKLETRLGMTLCIRGRGGFALTEQGRIAHSAATQLLAELDRFGEHIANAFETLSGSLTFQADDSFLHSFQRPISWAIQQLATDHPRLHLEYRMGDPEQVMTAVLEGAADLALTASPRRTEILSYQPVFSERMGLFCGRGHSLFKRNAPISLSELSDCKAIETYMDPTPTMRELFEHLSFSASGPTIYSRIHLVLSGAYIGFLPLAVAHSWVERGALKELQAPGSRFENTCFLISRRSGPEKPGARIFRKLLLQASQDKADA